MFVDWLAFAKVFAAALIGAVTIVLFYALGVRLLVRSGRVPGVGTAGPAEAIMHVTEKDLKRAQKKAEKAAAAPPVTDAQRRIALILSYVCFAVCMLAVIGGLLLIVL